MASHLASLSKRDFLELGNGLFAHPHYTLSPWGPGQKLWTFPPGCLGDGW